MYDPESALVQPDWRKTITLRKYKNLVLYANRYLNPRNEQKDDLYLLDKSGPSCRGSVVSFPILRVERAPE